MIICSISFLILLTKKSLLRETKVQVHFSNENSDRTSWFTIPFILSITEKFRQFNIKTLNFRFTTLIN